MIKIAKVIPSCDKYSSVWGLTIASHKRFGFFNNIPGYIVTNNCLPCYEGYEPVAVGVDVSWSSNLKKALKYIDSEYILLCIDDLIINKPYQIEKQDEIFILLEQLKPNYLRLNPTPAGSGEVIIKKNIRLIDTEDYYRTSTVFSIFKKSVLMELLHDNENAWEFEKRGTQRSRKYGGWFAYCDKSVSYDNLIIKSKIPLIQKKKYLFFFDSKIFDQFKYMSAKENLIYYLKELALIVFKSIPQKIQFRLLRWKNNDH